VKECVQCGADMIAPARAEYLSDSCVRNVWSCEACGYQRDDLVNVLGQATDCWSNWFPLA
jgi:transcription elongation factor Elf1